MGSRGEHGTYGPERARRAVVATTDPQRLSEEATWYLVSNLPHPGSELAAHSEIAPAHLSEIVRLYGLRMWVEQSYKQVKHVLGWGDYQVRSDLAIRRHWQLVCCAFASCWWAYGRLTIEEPMEPDNDHLRAESAGREKGNPECRGQRRSGR